MVTYSEVLFCPTNSQQPKEIQFTIKQDEEMQQILTFQKKQMFAWNVTQIITWLSK